MSLLYLRVTSSPAPLFVSRKAYGVEATAGPEAVALSVGATSRTWSEVPGNALMRLEFVASRPLEAKLRVWAGAADDELPPDFLAEEDRHR